MARLRFALLLLPLSLALGCPTQPSPAPQSSPPKGGSVDPSPARPSAPQPKASVPSLPLPTLEPVPGWDAPEEEHHPFGKMDLFRDRGSAGMRLLQEGRLAGIYLGEREERYAYEGRQITVTRSDGTKRAYLRADAKSVVEATVGSGHRPGEHEERVDRVLFLDEETGLPNLYLTLGVSAEGVRPAPGSARWRFMWESGRIVGEVSPGGRREFSYDALGRVQSWKDDAKRAVTLTREGAELSLTNASGERIRLVRDAEQAPRQAGLETLDHEFSYRDSGELSSAKSPQGTIDYSAEPGSRKHVTPWGSTQYRIERIPGAEERATRIDSPAGAFEFGYEGDLGPRTSLRYPNGVVTRYRYGKGQTLESLESSVLSLKQSFDKHLRLRARERDGEDAEGFSYDGYGRLAGVSGSLGEASYTYDMNGTRRTQSYGKGERLHDLVKILPSACHLKERVLERQDASGAWVAVRTLETYSQDVTGRLLSVRLAEGLKDEFGYDGFGRLVKVQRAGGPLVRYAYDPFGRISERRVGEGEGVLTRYVYDGLRLVAELGPAGATRVYAHGADLDEPLAYRDGKGPWVFLHGDERGSVLAYSDEAGARVDVARWSPFGCLTQAPALGRPLFFAGHRYDREAGLVLARARAYDPALNRFLGPDPAGLQDGVNPFQYAKGDPLRHVDPLGLFATPPTVRSYYGSAAPKAQLLLLLQVQSLRLQPNPKAPLINLFGHILPKLKAGQEAPSEGDEKTGLAPGAELVEGMVEVASSEEAWDLLESELGQEAKKQVEPHEWELLEAMARDADDDSYAHNVALLRERYAPTPEEAGREGQTFVNLAIVGDLRRRYLGDTWAGLIGDAARPIAEGVHGIAVGEERARGAATVVQQSEAELGRTQSRVAKAASLRAAPKATLGEPTPRAAPNLGLYAQARQRNLKLGSALKERLALKNSRKDLFGLRAEHAEVLQSAARVRAALAEDPQLSGPSALVDRLEATERVAFERTKVAEAEFREAMIQPMTRAWIWKQIEADRTQYEGKHFSRLLKESQAPGRQRALFGPLSSLGVGAQVSVERSPYAARKMALVSKFEAEERAALEVAKAEARAKARSERARASRKLRRGAPQGVTAMGEKRAYRPSGVEVAGVTRRATKRKRSTSGKQRSRRARTRASGERRSSSRSRSGARGKRAKRKGLLYHLHGDS